MRFLDTNICVEFLRGRLRAGYQHLREGAADEFQLPSIVVAELWHGAEHSSNPEKNLPVVEAFASAFNIVPFDGESAREYGRLRQLLGSQGKVIGDCDLMIASCALANRAVLVSNNVREFKRVPGLRLESWGETDL